MKEGGPDRFTPESDGSLIFIVETKAPDSAAVVMALIMPASVKQIPSDMMKYRKEWISAGVGSVELWYKVLYNIPHIA